LCQFEEKGFGGESFGSKIFPELWPKFLAKWFPKIVDQTIILFSTV